MIFPACVGGVIYHPGTGPYANASHGFVPQPPARVEVPTLPVTTQSPVSLIDAPIVPVEETVPVILMIKILTY